MSGLEKLFTKILFVSLKSFVVFNIICELPVIAIITMARKLPDRWLDYKAIGNVIQCSNFVAFKVPLHQVSC